MPFRSRKFWLKITSKRIASVACLACFLCGARADSFPNSEKESLDVVSSQATSMVLDSDRYLFLSNGSGIFRIDTATWSLASEQVGALSASDSDTTKADLAGTIAGLAIRGRSLFATQTDGDLLVFDLDSIATAPTAIKIISGTLGEVVADTETGADDDKLYILDKSNNSLIVYDIGDQTHSSITLTNALGQSVSPVALIFVPFPTTASTSSTDRVFITTNSGLVFAVNEGGIALAATFTLSNTSKDLPALDVTPDGDFVLVVNATDGVVHVLDTSGLVEIDADSAISGVNPIDVDPNDSLKGIAVTDVTDPSDTYVYVTGAQGVTVIDLNLSGASFQEPTLLDFDDDGASDATDNALSLSSVPGPVIASSSTDGYVYTSNGNAHISVITDNPFVTVSATSLGTTGLTTGGSFTVTFQSDETGTYRVLVSGGITATGTEVASGTVSAADTDVTTDAISFDASIFGEGSNSVFIFVTDSEGHIGRDATTVTVDTPPDGVEIVETDFGNEKIFVIFERLTVSDMDHYNIYADTDAAAVATKTTVAAAVSHPSSGTNLEGVITGLVNGTAYFIGIEAVDATGNVGTRTTTLSDGTAAIETPEQTIGLAESVGEAGCALMPVSSGADAAPSHTLQIFLFCFLPVFLLAALRRRKLFLGVLLLSALGMSPSHAEEKTPQWWSLEFKGGVWMPIDTTTKNFLGSCCDPTGLVEFGFLYKSKLGIEVGTGYVSSGGRAVGAASGAASRDSFHIMMIPIYNNVTFRADFKEDQLFVPYAKAGFDYWLFRQNLQGTIIKGGKAGLHGAAGLQIILDRIEDLSDTMETGLGVNDAYFTVEGRYSWLNGFGGSGLDLSHFLFTGGFLFEF